MADPPSAPDSDDDAKAGTGHEQGWRTRHRVAILGTILAKLGLVAVILVLPSGLAVAVGAAHGGVLLVMLGSAAVTLVVLTLRGKPQRLALSHRWIVKNRGHK